MQVNKPLSSQLTALVVVAVVAALGAIAGCGSSSGSGKSGGQTAGGKRTAATRSNASPGSHEGSVAVLYAGSLVNLMEGKVGPRFEAATGYGFEGFSGGSASLAQEIKGEVRRGDVFLSASPTSDELLEGKANGSWAPWYLTFAKSPLLIAYNPHSSFASQLESKPWWKVVTEPGFRLGRTDPKLDPKGVLTVKALKQAANEHRDPALKRLARDSSEVFPEEALVGRLQAGQLDAGLFYSVETKAVSPTLPTISIAPIRLSASYTIAILRGAPNRQGAESFVEYLLGGEERSALEAAGLEVGKPALHGTGIPASLREALAIP